MKEEIRKFIEPRTETLTWAGQKIVVRELDTAAELGNQPDAEDAAYWLLVRCAFFEDDTPVFAESDIPLLRSKKGRVSTRKIAPLLRAVNRVNGLDLEDEVKNSGAGPGAG